MVYPSLSACLRARPPALRAGPIMVILAEDDVLVTETVTHHLALGFAGVLLLGQGLSPPDDPRVAAATHAPAEGGLAHAVSLVARAVPAGTWIGHGHNGEFLFFPFSDHRRIGEMLAFHVEERRQAMTGIVVDLYAKDLGHHPNGVDQDTAHFDARGYYALPREDPDAGYAPLERQLDIYGGLRWRFEDHVPWTRRRIDRVMLFQARRDLTLQGDFTLNDPEMNTIQCPWHRNLTCCMVSFRTAKALRQSPRGQDEIQSFLWSGSAPFGWSGKELMERGFMEPGQWF